jgi:hypothetical protein
MKRHRLTRALPGLRWFRLVCLLVLVSGGFARVPAATNTPPLAANDWRQLWGKEGHETWHTKSEAEVLRLAEEGHPAAQFLAWEKLRGKDRQKAREMLDAAAAAGLAQAVFEKAYSTFIAYQSLPEKRLEGWALMQKAAETGYPYARFQIAEYETGRISSDRLVKPNLKRALEYFRDCADAGYPDAMAELALLYSSGVGEPRSEADSPHNLLRAAAQRGSGGAIGHLSDRYALGHGEAIDPLEAARLRFLVGGYGPSPVPGNQLVDAEGNPVAQDTVAWDNVAKAISLFVKTATQQNPEAAFALAKQYLEAGKPAEALVLFDFAKQSGSTTADTERKKLESSVAAEQKTTAAGRFPFLKRNSEK